MYVRYWFHSIIFLNTNNLDINDTNKINDQTNNMFIFS